MGPHNIYFLPLGLGLISSISLSNGRDGDVIDSPYIYNISRSRHLVHQPTRKSTKYTLFPN